MKKLTAEKNKTPFASGLDNLIKNSIYIVCSKTNGKEWNKFSKENIPEILFCDSEFSFPSINEIEGRTDSMEEAELVPFLYFSLKIKKNGLTIGMFMNADDFIVKKINSNELFRSIEKIIFENDGLKKHITKRVKTSAIRQQLKYYRENDRIFIDSRRKPKIIRVGDIVYITSKGNDSLINLADSHNLPIRKSLNSWENLLPPNIFRRVNRSSIINLNFVESISRWNQETYIIYLQNIKEPFTVSHRYAREMRSEFK